LGNLSGDWLQTVINNVLAATLCKSESVTITDPPWKQVLTERQWF
jgi:hypothetical protein